MKRMMAVFLIFAVFAGLFGGCEKEESRKSITVFAMDTVMTLTAYGENAEKGLSACEEELKRLEKQLSFTDQLSEVSRINRHAGEETEASEETAGLIAKSVEISAGTGGGFDITVGLLSRAWGFSSDERRVPQREEIAELLPFVGYDQIEISGSRVRIPDGAQIDLGGIAKGYAGDRLCEVLREKGVESAILSLGGNVMTLGDKPATGSWSVEIADPEAASQTIGVLSVPAGKAVVTSGDYQRYFEENGRKYHHILDPATGYPAESGLSSVTVICDSGTLADGLSTALFVLGKEKALALYEKREDFEAVLISCDGEITVTRGLADRFARPE